ncbi:MAG: hypothetical protein ABSC23_16375 [Bryobacteraceae bacterium]|jgi:hypothetical protein
MIPCYANEVRATQEQDIPLLRDFLIGAFGVAPTRAFLQPNLLQWKYFEPRPDWSEPRSFVLAEREVLLAHIGLWPVTLLVPAGPVPAIQALDWVRNPAAARGAGSLLRQRALSFVLVQVGAAGTPLAQQAREKAGFRPWAEIQRWAITCRPWLRYRSRSRTQPGQAIPGLFRDLAAGGIRTGESATPWRYEKVNRFTETVEPILPAQRLDRIHCAQSPQLLNYLLRCPSIRCEGYLLYRESELRGCFLLARSSPWARLVTLHVREPSLENLKAAYRAAVQAALEDPSIWGVVTQVSWRERQRALARAGFHRSWRAPVALLDSGGLVDRSLPVDLQMSESDTFFLRPEESG